MADGKDEAKGVLIDHIEPIFQVILFLSEVSDERPRTAFVKQRSYRLYWGFGKSVSGVHPFSS